MHGGMYFDIDTAPDFAGARAMTGLLRVEHYGKGAPPDTARFLRARPVPAVSGAFMSVSKPWFEKLGGFTEDYVFGHYEDADLCMKSRNAGCPPWLHDVKLWHLEGKGSSRRAEHEGGSLVNRWLFNKTWGPRIAREMLGPDVAAA
jgi:GT2 family glycosyltransferase